jgi:hypothetical protein
MLLQRESQLLLVNKAPTLRVNLLQHLENILMLKVNLLQRLKKLLTLKANLLKLKLEVRMLRVNLLKHLGLIPMLKDI